MTNTKNKIYLDNAATTPLKKEVWEAMVPYLQDHFGNPSSMHSFGRKTKAAIEQARKTIAKIMGATPAEIFFTSGGTEADNMAICGTVEKYNIQNIISSPLEHHAVTHTLDHLATTKNIIIHHAKHDDRGTIDLDHLKELLVQCPNALVTLMHGNNEIGNILDIEKVMSLCKEHKAYLHSDTVQTVGHYPIHLKDWEIHHITASAHKFHGPKGVGFIYIKSGHTIDPYIHGGAQERNMRGGTENVASIIGMAKALEIAVTEMEKERKKIQGLKDHMIQLLKKNIPGISFNGLCESPDSLYTVLNISLPPSENNEMILFSLDIAGVACSGGSACSSGSNMGSHVLYALGTANDDAAIRFSFSAFNTIEEVKSTVQILKEAIA